MGFPEAFTDWTFKSIGVFQPMTLHFLAAVGFQKNPVGWTFFLHLTSVSLVPVDSHASRRRNTFECMTLAAPFFSPPSAAPPCVLLATASSPPHAFCLSFFFFIIIRSLCRTLTSCSIRIFFFAVNVNITSRKNICFCFCFFSLKSGILPQNVAHCRCLPLCLLDCQCSLLI